jgi:predicted TPR repeat methyltransferase
MTRLLSFHVLCLILACTNDSYLVDTAFADTTTLIPAIEDSLRHGDDALSSGDVVRAIDYYQQGLYFLTEREEIDHFSAFSTMLSLHTNLATAHATNGDNESAIESYRNALSIYQKSSNKIAQISPILYDESTLIAAQASFFLGMVFQDLDQPNFSAEAYSYASQLDPIHWASFANLGAVYHDNLRNHGEALSAYNRAYELLTDTSIEVTDPPSDSTSILSQLQYRIGLCISHDLTQQCMVQRVTGPEPGRCEEMAAHAFSLAIAYDPDNESAKHMLATLTADATMHRASNVYVKGLFDSYAKNFEHSLVQELGYTGFERLRRGFDRAFNDEIDSPYFDVVVDAGCGTGLVGEQFRNISKTLIGVDLSEAIIEQAIQARPQLYDEVLVGDVTKVFRERKPISLIIAGDSFIYFGDLAPLFESIHDGLDQNGHIAFTLENVDKENENLLSAAKSDWRWQLTASGRFAHRKEYVERVGILHGLELVYYETMGTFSISTICFVTLG